MGNEASELVGVEEGSHELRTDPSGTTGFTGHDDAQVCAL